MNKKNKHHSAVPVQFHPQRTPQPTRGSVMVKQEHIQIRQSNMPDVETLEGYARFIPNGAERLMSLIEMQTAHRIEMEKTVIPSQIKESSRGQIFGFILSLIFGLVVSLVFLLLGHPNWAGTITTTTAVSMATIFALGKHKANKNIKDKNPKITITPNKD